MFRGARRCCAFRIRFGEHMSNFADTTLHSPAGSSDPAAVSAHTPRSASPGAPASRRTVGVVRVLRGRLAAPCRCCTDTAEARDRYDGDRG
jgi:hypothetical protein